MSWASAYLETRVLSADPVELIGISYEFAIMRVREARSALARGDISERCTAVSKTIAILAELESSLDYERGGEIASNLGRLYQYMRQRLTVANVKQKDEPLGEVESLLETLGGAWRAIGPAWGNAQEEAREGGMPGEWSSYALMEPGADHNAQSWSA
jgi:flagellar protein FliS